MREHKSQILKPALNIVIAVAALVLLGVFLMSVQSSLTLKMQRTNSQSKLDIAQQRLYQNALSADENRSSYDQFGQAKVDALAYFLNTSPDYAGGLEKLAAQWELEGLYMLRGSEILEATGAALPDFSSGPLAELISARNPVLLENISYYASELSGGMLLVGSRDSADMLKSQSELRSFAHALSTIKVGTTGGMIAVANDGAIAYPEGGPAKDADLKGVTDGYTGYVTMGGERWYCEARYVDDLCTLIAAVPEAELSAINYRMVNIALVAFALVIAVVVLYASLLRRDRTSLPQALPEDSVKLGSRLYLNAALASKLGYMIFLGIVVIFFLTFYMQSLAALSRQSTLSDAKLEAVDEILADNADKTKELRDEYTREYTRRAQNIAYLLRENPALLSKENMEGLANAAQIKELYVFNGQGRVIATNTAFSSFTLSTDPESQSYEFWGILNGYADVIAQEAMPNDTAQHGYMQYVGVSRADASGMVQLGISPKRLENKLRTTQLEYVLGSIACENNGMLLAVNKQDLTFAAYPKEKYIGRDALNYGVTTAALRDEYSGYQTIDSIRYYANCSEFSDYYVFMAVPLDSIYANRLTITLIVTLASLVVILLIVALMVLSRSPLPAPGDEQPLAQKKTTTRFFNRIMPSGKQKRVQTAASRWGGDSGIPWSEKTPEQKLQRILFAMAGVLGLALVIFISTQKGAYDRSSILSYILSLQWERTPSVFSLTYIAIVILEIVVIVWVARKLITLTTGAFGARSETVGRLLDSFLKYVSVIGAVFYSLNFLGIDSTTLMTSAGILTLIVGFGAQSLVGDILAGIFIVFEGEFRVGDIVTVGDYTGTVLEIGIRTTKIEDGGKNIKIFSNSAISGVVNMTKQYSFAFCDVGVEYGESLERIEAVLDKEFDVMRAKLPAIMDGPFYKGVVSLADSCVVLRIVAQCKEGNRAQLTRDLNRELKLAFDKHNINIPYPQIVVNRPQEFQSATRSEIRTSEQFVEEQKELGKDVPSEKEK